MNDSGISSVRPLAELAWETHVVTHLPGDPEARNFTRQVRNASYSEVLPTPVSAPRLLGWSDALAGELGIARPGADASLALLGGNLVLSGMRPYAARYGGHQFGRWAGQLGDGRAITLGEAMTPAGRREFQLKGAGPTPYSRRADGRAVLRSSLREFLCSEAMHFLGVPTTRALSLVATGDLVTRDLFYDGRPEDEPGAIVCRVAPSFLRFGNFEMLADAREEALLRRTADLLIADHYPEYAGAADAYGLLLDEIARRTAVMVAHWMRVGFVHGVMNTDNMSALGLTIDYGPYGWLEPFDPNWTPNTTDAQGRRYRYGNQPGVALWNVARLAESFAPLIAEGEERLRAALDIFRDTFSATHEGMLAQKLGLASVAGESGAALVQDLFALLAAAETDMTIFFRALADWSGDGPLTETVREAFYDRASIPAGWPDWEARYREALAQSGLPFTERRATMRRVSPKYVLRNYLAQTAIDAATAGDTSVLERLLSVLSNPYDDQAGADDLAAKRPEWARHKPGCSALSCSS